MNYIFVVGGRAVSLRKPLAVADLVYDGYDYRLLNSGEIFGNWFEVDSNKFSFLYSHGIYLGGLDLFGVVVSYRQGYGYIFSKNAIDIGDESSLYYGKTLFKEIVYFLNGESYRKLCIFPER